jgi:hypothetical protein
MMTIDHLAQKRNPDGGWPFRQGPSWTESTAYAVLALEAAGESDLAQQGIGWLLSMKRPDGGWPPCAGIEESCWATALVALIPPDRLGEAAHRGAIQWLLGTIGEESTWLYRLRRFLSGIPTPPDQAAPGWPWTPRTAAWVGPTSVALLALDKERRHNPSGALDARIEEGRAFLLNRMCHTGGWNHGAENALGYPADAYPETTGMALAALRGRRPPQVDRSLALAKRFLGDCRSADALNWLRLGLSAHGELPAGYSVPAEVQYRTVPEISVDMLISAVGRGTNLLWV